MFLEGNRIRNMGELPAIQKSDLFGLISRYQTLQALSGEVIKPAKDDTLQTWVDQAWAQISSRSMNLRSVHSIVRDLSMR
jgi:hypothetical protein